MSYNFPVQPGSPLAMLKDTPLGPALVNLIAGAPEAAAPLAGLNIMAPLQIPGMPVMPWPGPGLWGPTAPVEVPNWFIAQQLGQYPGFG